MAEDTAHAAERASLKERAAEELKAFFYITLYFWIFALVFELVRAMALKSEGIGIVSQGFAIVNALVLAKVALIMEAFYKKRLLRDTRLIYQVITHALLLALILIAFSLLEEGIKALLHHQSIASHFTSADVTFILAKGAVFFVTLLPFARSRSSRGSSGAVSSPKSSWSRTRKARISWCAKRIFGPSRAAQALAESR